MHIVNYSINKLSKCFENKANQGSFLTLNSKLKMKLKNSIENTVAVLTWTV